MTGLNNEAFSLLEILLAAIIFLVAIAGIFATLNAVRGPVANKENQLAASVFGKQVLEALYSQVSADPSGAATYYDTCASPCATFDLSVGTHQVPPAAVTAAGLSWPATLQTGNVCPSVASSCLVYDVHCSSGVDTDCLSGGVNPGMARRVDLAINWTSVP